MSDDEACLDNGHAWAMNPFGWYCERCGFQVAPDFSDDPVFNILNYGVDDS